MSKFVDVDGVKYAVEEISDNAKSIMASYQFASRMIAEREQLYDVVEREFVSKRDALKLEVLRLRTGIDLGNMTS